VSTTATQNEPVKTQPDQNGAGRKYKVLFIGPGPVPPSQDPRKNLQYHISEFCEGDFISTHWGSPKDYRGQSLSKRYNTLGSFRYHATFSGNVPRPLRGSWEAVYLLWKGLQLSWSRRCFDAIIVYGAFSWSFVGWLIRCCTGTKLVILIPGPPTGAYSFHPGLMNRIKSCVAKFYVPWILRRADGLRLLFPGQIDELPEGHFPPAFIFPDFAAVSAVPSLPQGEAGKDARYALFLGHPFERKGVDVLIKAFQRISDRHPEICLKIAGYCADLSPYRELAAGNPRIEFLPGQPHEKAMELMAGCTFFVLPSRAEGVPRVIMEAMAARKPVISTRIHGTPYLVGEGLHELLVEPDDVEGLASKMELLLNDPDLARRAAEEGFRRIFNEFSEECYKEDFRKMMESLVPVTLPRTS
jgi:glycosyltransferase involved in cell wall biosynthesis